MSSDPKRPNILYIHSHDTGRAISPFGMPVETPRLLGLAEQGVLFRNAFCASPTCSPSRAALLTGQAPHSCGMIGLAHRGFALNDYRHHLVHLLRESGYLTVLAGVQHEANGWPPDHPFDVSEEDRKLDGPAWKKIGYDRYLGDYKTAHETAVNFLTDNPRQPFFLSVGFYETHRPFPEPADEKSVSYEMVPPSLPDLPEIRVDFSRYRESVRTLDSKVGMVLDAMRGGLETNTIVIATTDHGLPFPRMKCSLTDRGIGVYLIIRGPHGFEGGLTMDSLVSHLDVFPTLCEILGLDPPERLQGKSLLPLVRGECEEIHDRLFAEVNYHAAYEPQRCARTKRWKYIARFDARDRPVFPNADDGETKAALVGDGWFPYEREALYDLYFDPQEMRNLSPDPRYADRLSAMRESLADWMHATSDPFLNAFGPDGTLPSTLEESAAAEALLAAPPTARINDADALSATEPTHPIG